MLSVASVEGEGLPDQDGGRHDTRTDARPLVDASEIEDHEEDKDCKQPAREDEEILGLQPLELNRLANTLVDIVLSHWSFSLYFINYGLEEERAKNGSGHDEKDTGTEP